MKAQIGRGKGQKGLLAYAFEGHRDGAIEKGARLIGGTCSGSTLQQIQAEFAALRKVRPDIEKPAWHCSLALKPGETLTDEQWSAVADKYMRGMGFSDKTLYAVVRHSDTEHDHIHVVASRIGLNGKIYLGQKEAARSMPLTNELAKEFGLSELAFDTRAEVKGVTAGEKGLMDRTGEIPTRIMLQTYIDDAVKGKPSFAEFVAKLEAQGVTVIPTGKTGQAQGMTFELDGVPWTGTKLGDKYKWKPLQSRIDYNPERDQPELDRLREQAAKPEITGELTNLKQPETANDQRNYYKHAPKPHPGGLRRTAKNGMRKLSECRLAHSRPTEKSSGLLSFDAISDRRLIDSLRWTEPTRTNKGKGNRTLDIAFDQSENGVYKWKSRDVVAIRDHGDRISVHSKAESAVRGSLQLAKEKGWKSIEATGSDEFRKKSWLIGNELGLIVSGYDPTEADREELKQRLADKEARYGKKNIRNTGAGREQLGRNQDRSRAGGNDPEHSHEFQLDSRRSGSEDRSGAESNVGARQQDRMAVEIQTSGSAGGDHSRGPDLARDGRISGNRCDIGSIVDIAGTLSDLAAPVSAAGHSEPTGKLGQQNATRSREYDAKIAAWERQSEALGAEKYRITLKPRIESSAGRKMFEQNFGNKGNKSQREAAGIAEKFWTPDEVKDVIYQLMAKNAQGYDIYITAISDDKHFIVVDDLTADKLAELQRAGFEPALVQSSSENNSQAVITIAKQKADGGEQALANKIVRRLNEKYGDPKFTGVIHPFRMAGFSNKKPSKNNYVTAIDLALRRNCITSTVIMQKLREDARIKQQAVRDKETRQERSSRLAEVEGQGQIMGDAVTLAYRREVKKVVGLSRQKGWELDWSRVDFAVTKELLKEGYKPELIEKAIVEASPGLADRHSDAKRYASDTVRHAAVDKDVLRYTERAQRASGSDRLER